MARPTLGARRATSVRRYRLRIRCSAHGVRAWCGQSRGTVQCHCPVAPRPNSELPFYLRSHDKRLRTRDCTRTARLSTSHHCTGLHYTFYLITSLHFTTSSITSLHCISLASTSKRLSTIEVTRKKYLQAIKSSLQLKVQYLPMVKAVQV